MVIRFARPLPCAWLTPALALLALACDPAPAAADDSTQSVVAHGAGSALCTEIGAHLVEALVEPTAPRMTWRPRVLAGAGCLLLGAAKEFLLDETPNWRDMGANGAGVMLGLTLTFLW
jgi:hypothetical protein